MAALEKARTALKAAEAAHVAASAEGEAADGEREVLLQQLEATKASVAGALHAHEAPHRLLTNLRADREPVHQHSPFVQICPGRACGHHLDCVCYQHVVGGNYEPSSACLAWSTHWHLIDINLDLF